MFNPNDTFVNLCLSGEAFANEIDDFVDAWHDGNDPRDLDDFLGMTTEEYAIWVERPETLRHILCARKHSMPLKEMITQFSEEYALAARASQNEAKQIVEWLKQTKRLP